MGNSKFDIIVSNPPPVQERNRASELVNITTITALDGGLDGLDFYRAIYESTGLS